jgi:hypothetical protein
MKIAMSFAVGLLLGLLLESMPKNPSQPTTKVRMLGIFEPLNRLNTAMLTIGSLKTLTGMHSVEDGLQEQLMSGWWTTQKSYNRNTKNQGYIYEDTNTFRFTH